MLAAILISQAIATAQNPANHPNKAASAPSISITGVPHAGTGGPEKIEPISGRASGVDFARYKVVIYAFAGGTWWVQPTVAEPLTDIDNKGNWITDTHLGTSYAALLVRASFKPPVTANTLPKVQGDVVAFARVAGRV
jgi:hypothetical protein